MTLEVERLALEAAGCGPVFEDLGVSSAGSLRPGLEQVMGVLGPDDVLVVWRLERLAGGFTDMLEVMAQVLLLGARVVSLQDDVDSGRLGQDQLIGIVKALLSHKGNIEAERMLADRRRLETAGTALAWVAGPVGASFQALGGNHAGS